jgi:sulfur-oxidizing protein SoxY
VPGQVPGEASLICHFPLGALGAGASCSGAHIRLHLTRTPRSITLNFELTVTEKNIMQKSYIRVLLATLAIFNLFAVSAVYANEYAEPDAEKSEYWPPIKKNMFGDRKVVYDRDNQYLAVYSAVRADDASSVPVMVRMRNPQSEKEWVKRVWLIADRNPVPIPGIFTFSKEAGLAHVETRIRLEDMMHVRAVAEMNDGRLFMAARWIKAFGGCTSPFYIASNKNLGKMKFRSDDAIISSEAPSKIQLMISHPNISGLAMDQLSKTVPEAYYIKHVSVTYGEKEIMSADIDASISENPVFYFYLNADKRAKLRANIVDTKDLKFEKAVEIEPGKPIQVSGAS